MTFIPNNPITEGSLVELTRNCKTLEGTFTSGHVFQVKEISLRNGMVVYTLVDPYHLHELNDVSIDMIKACI